MRSNLRPGHLLAAAGALFVLVSLWLPWYGIDLPDRLPGGVGAQMPSGPGSELAEQFARGLLAAFERAMVVTGWQAFDATDVVLALGAAGVLAAVGAVAAGTSLSPAAAGRVLAVAGVAGALLVIARLVSPPGPAEMLSIRSGGWVALAGAALVAVGGALATAGGGRAATGAVPPPDAARGWEPGASVPPPAA